MSEQAEAKWKDGPAKTVNRKQQRREQAEERQRLKPFHDRVREVEKELASNRSRLAELEARLADESLYADPDRKDELTQLIQDQAAVKSAIESLEWEWLEASEKLEQAT
jgi:ATP-binding cassette subfamily F protein 3